MIDYSLHKGPIGQYYWQFCVNIECDWCGLDSITSLNVLENAAFAALESP